MRITHIDGKLVLAVVSQPCLTLLLDGHLHQTASTSSPHHDKLPPERVIHEANVEDVFFRCCLETFT